MLLTYIASAIQCVYLYCKSVNQQANLKIYICFLKVSQSFQSSTTYELTVINRASVIFIRPCLNAYAPIITVRFSIINNISNVVGDDKTYSEYNFVAKYFSILCQVYTGYMCSRKEKQKTLATTYKVLCDPD